MEKEEEISFFKYPDRSAKSNLYEKLKHLTLAIIENPLLTEKLSKKEKKHVNKQRHRIRTDKMGESWMMSFIENNSDYVMSIEKKADSEKLDK